MQKAPKRNSQHRRITCHACDQVLNQADKPDSEDCGGDCLRCMARAGDPDCVDAMAKLEPNNPDWQT